MAFHVCFYYASESPYDLKLMGNNQKNNEQKGEVMELKDLLGEELYSQVDARIQEHNSGIEDSQNHVRFADLSEGNYVSREDYLALETEKNGFKTQLENANVTINSYKEMDIDGIQRSVKEWETKYNEDTQALQSQMLTQQKQFAAEKYLDSQKIKSPLSRKAIMQEFLAQDMEFKDGTFVGADEYMKGIREKYPDEFEKDEPGGKKTWVRGTRGTFKPQTKSEEEAYLEKKYGNNKYAK